jgi:hypothetical protein
MPKPKSQARPTDPNQIAHMLVERSTQEPERPRVPRAVSRVLSKLGRKGGKIGGKRRLETMTGEQRRESATRAANARWAKARQNA